MTGIPQDILDLIQVTRLPALPQVLLKLLGAFQDEDLSYSRLAELIGQDAALSARVLAVANSARYARGGRGVGLEQSLMALGTETTRALVLSAAMQEVYKGFPGADRVDLTAFWRSALGCASTSRLLAVEAGYPNPEEAYLAGLLHDVGRLALLAAVPGRYTASFALPEDQEGIIESETAAVGCHHADVGAWLVRRWNLMSFMADAVRFHHEPPHRVAGAHELVRIVLVGNGLLFSGGGQRDPYVRAAQRYFGLAEEQVEALVERARERVAAIAESLGVDLKPDADPDAAAAATELVERSLAEHTRRSALVGALQPALSGIGREVADALARCIRMLPLPVQEVCVGLTDDDATLRIQPLAGQDPRLAQLGFAAAADGGVFGRTLASGAAVDTFSLERAYGLAVEDRELLDLLGVPGLLAVPLSAGGRVVAVLGLGGNSSAMSVLRGEMPLLTALGAVAASALSNSAVSGFPASSPSGRERELEMRSAVHEASNRLGIVRNSLKIMSMRAEASSPARPELDSLDAEVERVGRILQRLVDGEPVRAGAQALDLNRLVQEEILVYSAALVQPGGVRLRMDLDPRLPAVDADGGLLRQALLNLVKNAVEAMPDGGEVTVSTRAGVNQGGAPMVSLSVSDNGPGLPPQFLERLFQPHESTKGSEHAGLGLSVTAGIVESQRGVVTCRTAPGRGTTMEILLPRAIASGPASSQQSRAGS